MDTLYPLRRSIATVSVSGTLTEKLAAIRAAGFDAVEIFENDLLYFHGTPRELRHIAEDQGLSIVLYQPFRDFEGVDAERLARNLERVRRKFDVMHELGVDRLLVCSSVAPDTIDDRALTVDQLGQLAEAAQSAGITACYEALAWGRHVRTWRQAWTLVESVGHRHLTLALDSFHTLSLGDTPEGIADLPGERIGFVQIADAPRMNLDVLEWSRHYRCFPGQGDFDLPSFTAQVMRSGYRGPLSLEIFNDGFRGAPPASTAADGYRSLQWLEEQTAARLAADAIAVAPSVPVLPALPQQADIQFLEFAVDDDARTRLSGWLEKLRFLRTGQHRSKDVTLYQHGAAAIILNAESDSFAGAFFQRHGLSLCASAFRVDDAQQALARASAFGYGSHTGRIGTHERVVPATIAPDGSLNYFVHEQDGKPTLFEADFKLTDFNGPTEIGPIVGIDHVCLSLPANALDSWVLYLRAMLGLQPATDLTVADPYGLVRSRALINQDRSVRLILNTSADPHTAVAQNLDTYHGSGLNHVAFGTHDIFRAIAECRAAGLPLLRIPPNYYDDLAVRHQQLSSAFIERLRSHHLLYDRDESGGEFLHAYTERLDRRFFLEIVERRGGYDGYGAVNTPVRLAAQAQQSLQQTA